MTPCPSSRWRWVRAFTLAELMISTALIGVLLFLLLPSLRGVKEAAQGVKSLSDLRSHASIMNLYTGDFKGIFPYLTDPTATYTVMRHPLYGSRDVVYFCGFNTWYWPLIDSYYEAGDTSSHVAPGWNNAPYSSYWYSASFIARPEFWNPSTRTGPEQWRPTLDSDVTFPSAKGVLLNRNTMFREMGTGSPDHKPEIGMVDGSARAVPWTRLTRAYMTGEGNWPGSWFGSGIRVMHTIDGVRGRDMQ